MAPGLASVTAASMASDASYLTSQSDELKVKLRLCHGGQFIQTASGGYKYTDGEFLNDSVPSSCGYAEFMYRITQKVQRAVSVKYLNPGDDLDPENLTSVLGDDDVKEMFDEYFRGLQRPNTPQKTFRIKVFLFDAETMDFTLDAIPGFSEEEIRQLEMGIQSEAFHHNHLRHVSRSTMEGRSSFSSNISSSSQPSAVPSTDTDGLWGQPQHMTVQVGGTYDVHVSTAAAHTPQPSGIQQVPPVENPTWQQKLAFPSKDSAEGTSNTQARSDSWQMQMQHSGGALAPGRSSASQQAAGADGADMQQLCDDMAEYGDEEPENDEAYREADDYADYEDCEEEEYEQQEEEEEQQEQEWGAGAQQEQQQAARPAGAAAGAAVQGRPLLQPLEQQLQEDVSMDGATPATQQALPVDPWDMTPKSRQALAAAGASGLPAAVLAQPWQQQQSQQQQPAPPQSGFGEDVNLALAAAASRLASKLPSRISVFGDGVDYDGSSPRQAEAAAGLETPAAGLFCPSQLGKLITQSFNDLLEEELAKAGVEPLAPGAAPAGGSLGPQPAAQGSPMLSPGPAPRPVPAPAASPALLDAPPLKEQVRVAKDEIKVLRKIGEGAFGEVSMASVFPFGNVAIKWLKADRFSKHSQTFIKEAELMDGLSHPNVLSFYGVVVESQGSADVVGIMTEYVRGGSLAHYLRQHRQFMPLQQRCLVARQAAVGMAYLHERKIVHFDLKPDNLLVDGDGMGMVVKVADFGLSKCKWQSYVSGCRDLRGTLPYMAPELVADPEHVSEKADVWSMGVVMWEMLTLEVPYMEKTPQDILMGLMCGNLTLEVPEWCEPEWRGLLEACLEPNPSNRPSFRDLARQLDAIYEQQP